MKKIYFSLFFLFVFIAAQAQTARKGLEKLTGNFTDDYGIKYSISDSLWIQHPGTKYHILKWDREKQYIIARNDAQNKSDGNKYTRIDYMMFQDMEPYQWGFCLSAYKAETDKDAEKMAVADRQNPKKGCNGYPFSRMKAL